MVPFCKVEETCLDCGKKFKMAVLRTHMRECCGGPSGDRSRSSINVSFTVMVVRRLTLCYACAYACIVL